MLCRYAPSGCPRLFVQTGAHQMTRPQPTWRSLLFVPVTSERFVAKAHTRGADAIILDLEDSLLPAHKAAARAALPAAVPRVAQGGADVVVRINRPLDLAVADDRKSTRLNSSHSSTSYAVFCLKKKKLDCSARVGAALHHLRSHFRLRALTQSSHRSLSGCWNSS